MSSDDLLQVISSPAGLSIAAIYLPIILAMLGGLLYMVSGLFGAQCRRLGNRLLIASVVIGIVLLVIANNFDYIKLILDHTPRWVLVPAYGLSAIIMFCWGLWGVIALCFGKTIATTVTADMLTWLLRGLIVAILAPYRGLSGLFRRFASHD